MDAFTQPQGQAMFELDDHEAYARTKTDIWLAIRAFNNCEVVGLTELPLEERECLVCKLPFDDPEDGEEALHVPVRLPCSHVLGKECLAKRTTPFGAWERSWLGKWEERSGWFEDYIPEFSGSADCPVCRQALFQPPLDAESALGLEARLVLWDCAYARTGCLRSEREEQSRADLIRYVEFKQLANGYFFKNQRRDPDRWGPLHRYHEPALHRLFEFALRRQESMLTPIQARIRLNLELISVRGIDAALDDPTYSAIRPIGEGAYGAYGVFGLDSDNESVGTSTDSNECEGTSTESNDSNIEDSDYQREKL